MTDDTTASPAPFSGKVALVCGASRGLGRAIARRLGAGGAEVIAMARTTGALEELDDEIRAAGGPTATLVPADVTDDPALERLGAAIHQRWGRLDILVNCAVFAPPLSPVDHVDGKEAQKCFAVNAIAPQRIIRCMAPLLRVPPRAVAVMPQDKVNCGKFHSLYEASRTAAEVYARAWAAEMATDSVAVLRPHPPAMDTALRARFRPGEDRSVLPPVDEVAAGIAAEMAAALAG